MNEPQRDHIVMTPKCKTACSTTLAIERRAISQEAGTDKTKVHVAGGDHRGIVINKEVAQVNCPKTGLNLTNDTNNAPFEATKPGDNGVGWPVPFPLYCIHRQLATYYTNQTSDEDNSPAQLSLEFRVFLVSAQTGKHTRESRTLQFWFAVPTSDAENAAVAQEFFRELVSPQDFPRDYVGFIKKVMKLLQHGFSSIRKVEVTLTQLEESQAPPPTRPFLLAQSREFTVSRTPDLQRQSTELRTQVPQLQSTTLKLRTSSSHSYRHNLSRTPVSKLASLLHKTALLSKTSNDCNQLKKEGKNIEAGTSDSFSSPEKSQPKKKIVAAVDSFDEEVLRRLVYNFYATHKQSLLPRMDISDCKAILFFTNFQHVFSLIYHPLHVEDTTLLQNDLNRINDWAIANKMKINSLKNKAISFTRKRNQIIASYTLGGETIPEVNKCKYLGITFSSDLGWGEHVTDTVGKAWRALHFVMRVLRKGSDKSKEIAYKSLVRPVMEYGAACWDPYRLEHVKTLEKIQKRALKCCRKNLPLKWDTLTDRRTRIRLCALFKTYRGEPAWREIKNRLQPPNYFSRNDHSYKLRERRQRTDTGKFSFLNRTIRDWNALPADLLKALPTTKNVFKNRLKDFTNRR
ncbi:hypothetical protein ANN_14025 [Periplaneta americana]|uniref:Uncharacterized protein n=1 Tax=Periplaneta americana TaxID=6978 RepID=A0ABQ8SV59_PERAM|nr:hypothetical protein ANN_14025 [Periplaneta americana]